MSRGRRTYLREGLSMPDRLPAESGAVIEDTYRKALAYIQRTKRFQLDPFAQVATCADEHRIAGMRGQKSRDHGQRSILQT